MTSRYPLARRFRGILVAFRELVALLLGVLAALLGIAIVVSPWIILSLGGWRLIFPLYLRPYALLWVGFALTMAFLNRRELRIRVQSWRPARKSTEFRKATPPVTSAHGDREEQHRSA
jgi:hypothetical protein